MIDRHALADVGVEVIRRAGSLSIKLFRNEDGGVSSQFELTGSALVDDDADDAAEKVDRPAALQFLRQLITAFEGDQ